MTTVSTRKNTWYGSGGAKNPAMDALYQNPTNRQWSALPNPDDGEGTSDTMKYVIGGVVGAILGVVGMMIFMNMKKRR